MGFLTSFQPPPLAGLEFLLSEHLCVHARAPRATSVHREFATANVDAVVVVTLPVATPLATADVSMLPICSLEIVTSSRTRFASVLYVNSPPIHSRTGADVSRANTISQ